MDAIQYVMKRTTSSSFTSGDDAQNAADVNIFDAVPVQNNPGTAADWTPLSVKQAFDNYLLGKTQESASDNPHTMRVEQSSLHFKSLSAELTISNLSDKGAMIDLYELVPQHNLGATEYSTEIYANGFMSPSWCFNEGLKIDNDSVIMTEDELRAIKLGAKPQNSTRWNKTWKIVKQVRLNMSSGAVHRHKSFYEINKTVSHVEYGQLSALGAKFAGWNPVYMLVSRGVPETLHAASDTSIKMSCNIQVNYEASPDRQSKVIVYDSNL